MGDSAQWKNIPKTVNLAALYRNGLYAVNPADAAAWFGPKVGLLWIDVDGSQPGSCQILDVEKWDATPDQAPGWIKRRRAVVHTSLPTIYCDRSTLTENGGVIDSCQEAGLVAGRDYQLWISTLDGTSVFGPGIVASQYHGGPSAPFDLSTVYDDRWHPFP